MTVKAWPDEVKWTIVGDNGVSCSSPDYSGHWGIQHPVDNCVLAPGHYTLTCNDSEHDGWHGGFLHIGEKEYCIDFDGHKETH